MTKRGLIVGINYSTGPENIRLQGCVNDTRTWASILSQAGYSDVRVIAETPGAPPTASGQPTKKSIMGAIRSLMDSARPGDKLFFSFSGHGIQVPDYSGDEADGFDEALVPIDAFELAARGEDGYIIDDQLNKALVGRLPAGCTLTVVFDCCHSGTGLDLKYTHSVSGGLSSHVLSRIGGGGACFPFFASLGICTPHVNEREVAEATLMAFRARECPGGVYSSFAGFGRGWFGSGYRPTHVNQQLLASTRARGGPTTPPPRPRGEVRSRSMGVPTSQGKVVLFSGCLDDQTSADIGNEASASGALTFAFAATMRLMLTSKTPQSYAAVLCSLRDFMRSRNYPQQPQLSSNYPLDPAAELFEL